MVKRDGLIGSEATFQTPLYKLLHEHLPEHHSKSIPSDLLSVSRLSRDLRISTQAIYAWLNQGSVPASRLAALTGLPGSTLTFERLAPFATFKGRSFIHKAA